MSPRNRRLLAVALGVLASGLMLFNTAARRQGTDFHRLMAARRLWDDLAVAVTRYLDACLLYTSPSPRD